MIIVPTHKCHKSPFKHSKTIYVFTFGRVAWWFSELLEENKKIFLFLLAFFHIYMKKDLEAFSKSILEKYDHCKVVHNTRKQHDLHYLVARFNEKGCLPVWDGDALSH